MGGSLPRNFTEPQKPSYFYLVWFQNTRGKVQRTLLDFSSKGWKCSNPVFHCYCLQWAGKLGKWRWCRSWRYPVANSIPSCNVRALEISKPRICEGKIFQMYGLFCVPMFRIDLFLKCDDYRIRDFKETLKSPKILPFFLEIPGIIGTSKIIGFSILCFKRFY